LTRFVYKDGSKKGGSLPLGAVAIHPSSHTSLKILVTSTPAMHTIKMAELEAIDLGLKLGQLALLSDNI
jgi:hypothetical protein